jgi:uncharacterized protein (DUF1501 family)
VAGGKQYKAVVVLLLDGGLDSFNLLVPHSQCRPHPTHADLYSEYREVRDAVAIHKAELLPIPSALGTQPCDIFGVNPAAGALRDLYTAGQLAFVANVGALVKPVIDKEAFRNMNVRTPPNLFSHSDQSGTAQNVHAESTRASGVMGRIFGALAKAATPYRTEGESGGVARIQLHDSAHTCVHTLTPTAAIQPSHSGSATYPPCFPELPPHARHSTAYSALTPLALSLHLPPLVPLASLPPACAMPF